MTILEYKFVRIQCNVCCSIFKRTNERKHKKKTDKLLPQIQRDRDKLFQRNIYSLLRFNSFVRFECEQSFLFRHWNPKRQCISTSRFESIRIFIFLMQCKLVCVCVYYRSIAIRKSVFVLCLQNGSIFFSFILTVNSYSNSSKCAV